MGEIKSAWELALEKVERLGKLSPEELRRQKEEKYGAIGQALADRYLGGLAMWQLKVELDKYKDEERDGVERALVSKLIQAIELGNYERLLKVLEGVSTLERRKAPLDDFKEIEHLFEEYKAAKEEGSRETERSAKEVLHRLRIAGSAIEAIRPEVIPEWQESLNGLAQPYRERLVELRKRLGDTLDIDL